MEETNQVLKPEVKAQVPLASISPSFCGATFIQFWRMPSKEAQWAWLDVMRRNIHLLQVQSGFRSMSLHPSLDGRNAIVYAQWDSEESLKAAVERPDVKAARNELDSHGDHRTISA
jgi:quinol monooxygenase YgiN